MKTLKKVLLPVLAIAVLFGVYTAKQNAVVAKAVDETPSELIGAYVERVQNGEYEDLYNESFSVMTHMNDLDTYTEALKDVYGDLDSVQYKTVTDNADEKEFNLYSNNKKIAALRCVKQGDAWVYATVFNNMETWIVEVKHGEEITANGTVLGEDQLIEEKAVPTNLSGLTYTQADLNVDQYRVQNNIGEPVIARDDETKKTSQVKDVTSNTIYVGSDVTTDEELQDMIINYAELCAMYPAQDDSLYDVANISVTDANWYTRFSELQNDWFTAHYTSEFSNEKVLKILKQGSDTMIANVIFDYYATNGDVERTWTCGYQMTLLEVDGVWKIAGMGIDSTMNPNSKYYEAE